MASTAWKTRSASEKQIAFIQKLADEKAIGDLEESIQEKVADVASGQSISGGEASEVIDALIKAPRKARPSAGFAPLVSTYAARVAAATAARAEYERLDAEGDALLAAAGGKAGVTGTCNNCAHSAHADKICPRSDYHSLGWDDGYNIACTCEDFVAVTAQQGAAWDAKIVAAQMLQDVYRAEDAIRVFERGDHVVVVKGRKIKIGSKGQIIKVSENQYGWSAFLKLDADGSTAWTALSNIDHQEA